MQAVYLEQLALVPNPLGGNSRQLVDRPELRLVNLVLQPGEVVEKHQASVEVVFLVLAGRGRIYAGKENVDLEQGQLLSCPSGILRSVEAGQEGLNLLVVRAPNQ